MSRLNRFFVQRGWKAAVLVLVPVCPAFGDPIPACPSAAFNVYISTYQNGCSVGPLIFSNFAWSALTVPPKGMPNAPDPITSDLVKVAPLDQGGWIGLSFTADWATVGIQEQTNYFSFAVTASPGALILGARATIAGQAAGKIGTSQAAYRDTLCPGGTFDQNEACIVNGKPVFQVVPYPTEDQLSDTKMFTTPVDSVGARSRIRVVSIDPNSSASLAQATSQFLVTPEPSSFTLLLIGLSAIAIGMAWRRPLT